MGEKKPLNELLIEVGQGMAQEQFIKLYAMPVLITLTKSEEGSDRNKTLSGRTAHAILNPWNDIEVHIVGNYGTHPFTGQFYCIGRNKSNDVVIEDKGVSGLHAIVSPDTDGKGYFVHDAGSKNGTFLAERPGAYERVGSGAPNKQHIRNGYALKFGEVQFTFYEGDGLWFYLQNMVEIYKRRPSTE